YRTAGPGEHGCAVAQCFAAITSVGNPVIWGLAPLAVIVLAFAWALRRDWRAGALLATLLATWGPWVTYHAPPIFSSYTIVMVPFTVLALTYSLGLVWGRSAGRGSDRDSAAVRRHSPSGLQARRLAVGLVRALAVLAFGFFWPVWTATYIPREAWELRMWNPTWI